MRNISAGALAEMAKFVGTEPINIVEIQWATNGPRLLYGDRKVDGVDGRILTLDGLEDVVNLSNSGTSQSVSLTLDDHDGLLKTIFNNTDIHKKEVWVYQWYKGLPLDAKFLLFCGVIVSPVTWKEGDRTLSFTVVTKTEDREIGFSAEDGQFPNLPQGLVGKVWPLCFGTCIKVPVVLVDEIISRPDNGDVNGGNAVAASTLTDTGIQDPSLDPKIKDNTRVQTETFGLARTYFIGYLQASHTARKKGELDDLQNIDQGKGKFSQLAKQYLALGNKALLDASKLGKKNNALKTVQNEQKKYERNSISLTDGSAFPQATPVSLNIAGAVHTGIVVGNEFIVESRQHPELEKYNALATPAADILGPPTIVRDKFFYAPSGYPVRIAILSPNAASLLNIDFVAPVRYIVSGTMHVQVTAVFAYKSVDGIRQLMVVPTTYYATYDLLYGSLPATMIIFPMPMSQRQTSTGESEGWEDEIFCNVLSPVGPNAVDIMQWLIETYTDATVDATSFASVRASVNNYPCNFAYFTRPNVFTALSEIAYQSRCMIYLKNDVFYLKYLSKKETPVATITEADIEEASMEVSYTETEEIHTKIKAEWKSNYKQSSPNLIILRYNTDFYGVQEHVVDWYIYNQQLLVQKSATFWLIREANTYKRITFKVGLDKLNIETLDTITLNFTGKYIANGAIDCIVLESKFNTDDYSLTLTCWCPVRAGEMEEYVFAFPANLNVQYVFPTETDITTGRAGTGKNTPFNNDVKLPVRDTAKPEKVEQPFTGDQGNGGQVSVTHRPISYGVDPSYVSDVGNIAPEIISKLNTALITPGSSTKPPGTTDYKYEHPPSVTAVTPTVTTDDAVSSTFPGFIIGHDGDGYIVALYTKGLDNDPDNITGVRVVHIADGETFENDTPVIVSKLVYTDDITDEEITEYYIQPPVWQ